MSNKDGPKHERKQSPVSCRKVKKLLVLSDYLSKQESKKTFKLVTKILQKEEAERNEEELTVLKKNKEVVKRIQKNKERKLKIEERTQEREDSEEELQKKCAQLAGYIKRAKRAVVYTGAGISTAASIPDYRGPQGVWTLLQKGESLEPLDLSDAEPTFTHMCIAHLHKQGHVKHVVSQNCDGLHLRSGLPRTVLSEVHGNMYIEVCYKCKPHREYIRLFDTTENTGVRRHQTGRHCKVCGGQLRDTIVHFGEKGGLKSPYRWKEAARAAERSDLILCLGSSLKILKRYGCLWLLDRTRDKRPNLVIVNLQWTPKDDAASLKINGRCDDVFNRVMKQLGYTVTPYIRANDPIFSLGTTLTEKEHNSTSKKFLERPVASKSLRSTRRTSRTPTPTPSDCASNSTSSSSNDSSDKVDIDTDKTLIENDRKDSFKNDIESHRNEIDHVKTEESVVKKNPSKKDTQKECDGSSHLIQQKTPEISAAGKYMKTPAYLRTDKEPKSLIADNFHDYTHKIDQDTNGLQTYRQLLELHLLQKQLEWLKTIQQSQPSPQQAKSLPCNLPFDMTPHSQIQSHNFTGFSRPQLSHQTFGTSKKTFQSLPVLTQISQSQSQFVPGQSLLGLPRPSGPHQDQHRLQSPSQKCFGQKCSGALPLSPPGFQFLSRSPHFMQDHVLQQGVSLPYPVGIFPNAAVLSHEIQLNDNCQVGQEQSLRKQMEAMQTQLKHNVNPEMNGKPQDYMKLSGTSLQSEIQKLEIDQNMELLEKLKSELPGHTTMLPEHVFGNMMYSESGLNCSPLNCVPNVSESRTLHHTSLSSTIQKCVQNIGDPKQLVLAQQNNALLQHQMQEKGVLDIQKYTQLEQREMQERWENEIHRQLKLEVLKFHEQEEMQNKLRNLLQKSEVKANVKEETSDICKDQLEKNMNIYDQKPQNTDHSILCGSPFPTASSVRSCMPNLSKVSVGADIFKEPLPYPSHVLTQIDGKKPSQDCSRETLGLSNTYTATISSSSRTKSDPGDCKTVDSGKRINSNKIEIPGFSELVNSLTMCQSCQFLREYGVKKRSCLTCRDLKTSQTTLNTQWLPERQPDIAKSPKKESPCKTRSEKAVLFMKKNKSVGQEHSSENAGLARHSKTEVKVNHPYLGHIPAYDSETKNIALTPNLKNSHSDRQGSNIPEESMFGHKPKFELGCNEESANYKFLQDKTSTSKSQNSASSSIQRTFSAHKHDVSVPSDLGCGFERKSNSDSELCKSVGNTMIKENTVEMPGQEAKCARGMKRCHSENEVNGDNDESDENGKKTDNADDSQPVSKKRKLERCISVPGWFGKGLNVKKRRKYY